jgi:nucleoid-associated protein YgaU
MGEPSGNVVGAVPRDATAKAYLEVKYPENAKLKIIPFCFNPTELAFAKQTTFAEVPIPGLTSPPIQFVRGASEKLTFDAIVDTSDDMTDVRVKYVDNIRNLMNVAGAIHAPPVVIFHWDTIHFTGVLESLGVTYTLFSDEGKPVRAKLAIGLKEFTTIAEQAALAKKQSPDVEKAYVASRGDTLSGIAEQAYGDPAAWRAIARANGIADPRHVEPGAVLTIPRLATEPA